MHLRNPDHQCSQYSHATIHSTSAQRGQHTPFALEPSDGDGVRARVRDDPSVGGGEPLDERQRQKLQVPRNIRGERSRVHKLRLTK